MSGDRNPYITIMAEMAFDPRWSPCPTKVYLVRVSRPASADRDGLTIDRSLKVSTFHGPTR